MRDFATLIGELRLAGATGKVYTDDDEKFGDGKKVLVAAAAPHFAAECQQLVGDFLQDYPGAAA